MKTAQNLLRELGIHATRKGYHYLLASLEMTLENEQNLILYSKMLFPTVAQKYHTTPSRVERDIRTAIAHCWNSPGKEKLQNITPYNLYKQPSLGEFIVILHWHLKFLNEKP